MHWPQMEEDSAGVRPSTSNVPTLQTLSIQFHPFFPSRILQKKKTRVFTAFPSQLPATPRSRSQLGLWDGPDAQHGRIAALSLCFQPLAQLHALRQSLGPSRHVETDRLRLVSSSRFDPNRARPELDPSSTRRTPKATVKNTRIVTSVNSGCFSVRPWGGQGDHPGNEPVRGKRTDPGR